MTYNNHQGHVQQGSHSVICIFTYYIVCPSLDPNPNQPQCLISMYPQSLFWDSPLCLLIKQNQVEKECSIAHAMSQGGMPSAALPQVSPFTNTKTTRDVQHLAEELRCSQCCCTSPVTSVIQCTNLTQCWKILALVECGFILNYLCNQD